MPQTMLSVALVELFILKNNLWFLGIYFVQSFIFRHIWHTRSERQKCIEIRAIRTNLPHSVILIPLSNRKCLCAFFLIRLLFLLRKKKLMLWFAHKSGCTQHKRNILQSENRILLALRFAHISKLYTAKTSVLRLSTTIYCTQHLVGEKQSNSSVQ